MKNFIVMAFLALASGIASAQTAVTPAVSPAVAQANELARLQRVDTRLNNRIERLNTRTQNLQTKIAASPDDAALAAKAAMVAQRLKGTTRWEGIVSRKITRIEKQQAAAAPAAP